MLLFVGLFVKRIECPEDIFTGPWTHCRPSFLNSGYLLLGEYSNGPDYHPMIMQMRCMSTWGITDEIIPRHE